MSGKFKTVLIIAYYFPPSGGAGVQRTLKFVKYLHLFGWRPVVLTVHEHADFPIRDESLAAEVPDTVPVYRTKIFEPYDLYRRLTGKNPNEATDVVRATDPDLQSMKTRFIEWVRATFFIPDARCFWVTPAVKAGLKIIKDEQVDLIFSTSSPNTCHLIGRALKRKSKLPWVADFRDSWIWLSTPKRWFLPKSIDRAMEKSVLLKADHVVAATSGVRQDLMSKIPHAAEGRFSTITNGYDEDDFKGHGELPKENKFIITHTGALYDKRSPVAVLKAAESLFLKYPDVKKDFLFRFVGRCDPRYFDLFEKMGSSVEHVPYVKHRESVSYLMRSDLLLLLIDTAVVSKHILTGKIFEYVGAQRPILALAPEGDAADLIKRGRVGTIVDPVNLEAIEKALHDFYTRWKANALTVNAITGFVPSFERKQLTGDLTNIFEMIR